MWILFSPSEKKCLTHQKEQRIKNQPFYQDFICDIGLKETLKAYKELLQSGKESEIKRVFGVKNIDLDEIACAQNLMQSPLLPAVLRYIGVAFSALDFEYLPKDAQEYLNRHLLIFSNLLGLLRAKDKIPYYDLKQGEGFQWGGVQFDTKSFYAKNSDKIWEYLIKQNKNPKDSLEILDLRAGFYQKCFLLDKIPPHLDSYHLVIYQPNFIKNGKVVSHYAKHYRGALLRACAKEKLANLADLKNLHLEGLELESLQVSLSKKIQYVVLTYAIKNI
ncbi:YaaA family protein [Helicobacter sp.]|uniref:YaaA family protein n=1 Tax=Helicobacter sp. TaxID=218 RepID=UPI0019C397E8|nr:YaaA family protein [Helicobacter sp.]MBD5164499.1 YaaA family protein [Helicobacter sp.]